MSKKKLGDYKLKNVLDAFETEAQALSKIHMTVSNQLHRLQLEEQLLGQMLQRAQRQGAAGRQEEPRAQQQQHQQEELPWEGEAGAPASDEAAAGSGMAGSEQ